MRTIVRPAAAADIDEAYLWYQAQREGLGEEFLAAAQAAIAAITAHPERYPVIRRDTRRYFCGDSLTASTAESTTTLWSWWHACMDDAIRRDGRRGGS
jgi:plasmid stabilization system protein ParE